MSTIKLVILCAILLHGSNAITGTSVSLSEENPACGRHAEKAHGLQQLAAL